ncbi:MAG: hypothetical protein MK108_14645 [Mariniblastus sp.]|nr:hypothetical protein [Mariniblastus sp.]
MKYLRTTLFALLSFPTFGLCQDTDLKSPKAKAALREYERKLEEVDKEIAKQLKDLEKSYQMKAELVRARLLSNLNEAMEEEARKVNLEEANKINAEIERRKAMPLPKLNALMAQAEKQPVLRIPKTALEFNGHHYAINTTPMTWHTARDYCQHHGAHLITIQTNKEFEFAKNLIPEPLGLVWVDGSDEAKEGVWTFSDGKKTLPPFWRPGEPNGGEKENVVCIDRNSGFGDAPSERKRGFIMEWDN